MPIDSKKKAKDKISLNVQFLNDISSKNEQIKRKEEHFYILRKIYKKPQYSQRKMAEDLGFSLETKLLHKGLRKKGPVKINNFKKNPEKLNYIYVLTPKGISKRPNLP